MTIFHPQPDLPSFSKEKKGYRTLPEKLVGLGIFLSVSFGAQLITKFSQNVFGGIYFFFIALGMFSLWSKYSLKVLKLELSVFLSQIVLQILWSLSFFVFDEPLLALVALLLLWFDTLLIGLLFWKREKISGTFYFYPLVWVFYLAGVNMMMCISTS